MVILIFKPWPRCVAEKSRKREILKHNGIAHVPEHIPEQIDNFAMPGVLDGKCLVR